MGFESKILSREISQIIWERGKTVGTAESCTGGRVAEAIISVPGASNYFKGSVVAYVDEVKEKVLGVDPSLLKEKTAVCEEVAAGMVKGVIKLLGVDYAIAVTGYAGPSGGTRDIPVGTIWLACGTAENIVTMKIEEDLGRDLNIANATHRALQLFLQFLHDTEECEHREEK